MKIYGSNTLVIAAVDHENPHVTAARHLNRSKKIACASVVSLVAAFGFLIAAFQPVPTRASTHAQQTVVAQRNSPSEVVQSGSNSGVDSCITKNGEALRDMCEDTYGTH